MVLAFSKCMKRECERLLHFASYAIQVTLSCVCAVQTSTSRCSHSRAFLHFIASKITTALQRKGSIHGDKSSCAQQLDPWNAA